MRIRVGTHHLATSSGAAAWGRCRRWGGSCATLHGHAAWPRCMATLHGRPLCAVPPQDISQAGAGGCWRGEACADDALYAHAPLSSRWAVLDWDENATHTILAIALLLWGSSARWAD